MQKIKSNQQQGFTLVEVMVAMVIFSIGLLGLAGLQSLGMQNNQTAFYRTVAMQLATNMASTMRVNNIEARSGTYTVSEAAITTAPKQCTTTSKTTTPVCTTAELISSDIYEWKQKVATLLPQGLTKITSETVSGVSRAVICVMWNEARIPAATLTVPDCTDGVYAPKTNYKFYTVRVFL